MVEVEVVLVARTSEIAHLIKECAEGRLPFSGPNSLHSKVAAMGYKTTSLYEMVRAYECEYEYEVAAKQSSVASRQ